MIYISGPMTGLPDLNFPAFHAAAAALRAVGLQALNPAELDHGFDPAWDVCLRGDIVALVGCNSILMLDGWMQSKGARLERHIAVQLGMPVHYDIASVSIIPVRKRRDARSLGESA